ncbi:MAG: coproporphyrinogen dehydrogenase HemZ [Clostridia bacterium]|nr:coproporphyrinogen dehydrogenase HemZ [Clostridia bacterium]
MKLRVSGNINQYYVQTLCMIFFPGEKFSEDADIQAASNAVPELSLALVENEDGGVNVHAELSLEEKYASCDKIYPHREDITHDRLKKIAVGDAILSVCGEVIGYRPSWGMLVGVRPSKVATEMLESGMSKTRVKKTLVSDYFVIPKKAALATEVALNEAEFVKTADDGECSVYISIPFCPTRCAYCSFVSYTSRKLLATIPDYLIALGDEINKTFALIRELGLRVKTVYIGGGTPTILDEDQLDWLLSMVEKNVDVRTLDEYTLEAGRPDTITEGKMRVARLRGVNRISVNPQTLNDDVLKIIGRSHTADDFLRAYDIARNSEIPIINTDVIAGLPGDKFSSFAASYDKIVSLKPENITVHTFSVKKASDFLKNSSHIYSIRGGDVGKCVDYSQITAQHEGYEPYYMYRQKNTVGNYENVGFALGGYKGLYNIYMMEEIHSIFACGAGAVSKFVDYNPKDGSPRVIERFFNPKYPYEYLSDNKTEQKLEAAREFYERRSLKKG